MMRVHALGCLLLCQASCHLVFGHAPSLPADASVGVSDRAPGLERSRDGSAERGLDAPRRDAPVVTVSPICSPDNWCWENPRPHGNTIYSVWGSGPNDVHAVGGGGVTLHFDGAKWDVAIPPPGRTLRKVWGLGPNEAYAVGEAGTVLEWSGAAWSPRSGGTAETLLAVGGHQGRIVATGEKGVVLERSSSSGSWSTGKPLPAGALNAVESWAGILYLLGADGQWTPGAAIFSDEKGAWAPHPVECSATRRAALPALHASWRAPSDELWVGAGLAQVVRFNSDFSKCTAVPSPPLDVQPVIGIWGSAEDDVYAIAASSGTRRFDGKGWNQVATGVDEPRAIWGSGANDILVGAAGGRLCRRGAAGVWHCIFPSSGETRTVHGVWGSGAADVFAVGGDASSGFVLHFDGAAWQAESLPPATPRLTGVWGSGTTVFAVGRNGTILRKDQGTPFVAMSSGTSEHLEAIWGRSAQEVFAVGANGTFLELTSGVWSLDKNAPKANLAAITGDANRVFVVGGTLLGLRAAGGWSQVPPPTDVVAIHALALADGGELVAGGNGGELCRRIGDEWQCMSVAGNPMITALFRSGKELLATAFDGTIVHWDGTAKAPQRMASGTGNRLRGGAAIGGHLYAVGDHGTILHRAP